MIISVFDHHICSLGEGLFWNKCLGAPFWFDIKNGLMLSQNCEVTAHWQFDFAVSSGYAINKRSVMIASEIGLIVYDLDTDTKKLVVPVEKDNHKTRSNDGRVDPWGGYWFSTMRKEAQESAGSIYRYYRGEIHKLFQGLTIPNSICFSSKTNEVFFSDTAQQIVWKQRLDEKGFPVGDRHVFLDLKGSDYLPDGAVCDENGYLWIAIWGAGLVSVFDGVGRQLFDIELGVPNVTCPLICEGYLFVTSATEGLSTHQLEQYPDSGKTFQIDIGARSCV